VNRARPEAMNSVAFTAVAEARALAAPGSGSAPGNAGGGTAASGSFDVLLDIINPLQHLPVIGSVYRALTGDSLSDAGRLVGDTLYGGPLGLVSAGINLAVKHESGKDVGQHMIDAALFLQENAGA
jgi:hypothetical protein